jgi:hypothetical protein
VLQQREAQVSNKKEVVICKAMQQVLSKEEVKF